MLRRRTCAFVARKLELTGRLTVPRIGGRFSSQRLRFRSAPSPPPSPLPAPSAGSGSAAGAGRAAVSEGPAAVVLPLPWGPPMAPAGTACTVAAAVAAATVPVLEWLAAAPDVPATPDSTVTALRSDAASALDTCRDIAGLGVACASATCCFTRPSHFSRSLHIGTVAGPQSRMALGAVISSSYQTACHGLQLDQARYTELHGTRCWQQHLYNETFCSSPQDCEC